MRFLAFACLCLTSLATLPALALDLTNMTDEERTIFRDEVRNFLMENPQVIMDAVAVLQEREQQQQAQADLDLVADNKADLFDDGFSWVGGNPDGDITLIEFLDYRCGYCKRAHDEVAKLLENDGNIRLIVKELPILGAQSTMASRFALATRYVVDEDAYGIMHEALMTMRADVTEASLVRLADDLGYDGMEILAGMDDPRIDAIIEENYALAQAMQISGTPTFVMGRQLIRGFMPGDAMAELIAEERIALQ
jgi:protein-disulfide isomerase